MIKIRSNFTIVQIVFGAVFLVDNCDDQMSVTNDAENVVHYVLSIYPKRRIIYRDTDGNWDELVHNGIDFTNFAPLSSEDRAKYKAYLT
jgi:hypothetical protein